MKVTVTKIINSKGRFVHIRIQKKVNISIEGKIFSGTRCDYVVLKECEEKKDGKLLLYYLKVEGRLTDGDLFNSVIGYLQPYLINFNQETEENKFYVEKFSTDKFKDDYLEYS